jgi:Fe-S oxidoreductase/nitrate reductase gamma subunit
MEFTREIYWNVGHGAATLVPMYLLALGAFVYIGYVFKKRVEVYRMGLPLQRNDHPRARLRYALSNVLLQRSVIGVRWPGLIHGLFFWGFLVLVVGTTLVFIQADFTDPLFGLVFLKGNFYKFFSLALDLAGLGCIAMLATLLVRRYFYPPKGLETKGDDALMHGLLLAILATGFLLEGARMAVTELGTPLALWSPVGLGIAHSIKGMGEGGLLALHQVTWWFHLLLVIGFFLSIPTTKFKHLITTSANSFFRDTGPKGKLATLNLEDEDAEIFGATKCAELTWKDLFDADACSLCLRCQDQCPAYATGKPLSPMKLVNQIGDAAFHAPETELIEEITRDVLWACTTCRACQEICPAEIAHVGKIVELRRAMVLMEGEFPGEEVMTAMEATEVNGNPLGVGYAERGDWATELGVLPLAEDSEVELCYFVGCYGSFDKRNIAVAKAFLQLCHAAGVKVGILGKEEKCCGEPMRKMGNEYLYQSLAMENIETIRNYGVKKIVTSCPHCFNTLNKDYRDLGFTPEVVSHTVFLEELLTSGRLSLSTKAFACTYHDSCYLGRHNDIYDAPRHLIEAAGGQIKEMDKCRAESFCCSAGGGRILADEKIGERMNLARVKMALATEAPLLLSNCPFCLTMFEDGVKGAEAEGRLMPKDVAEILAERLPGNPTTPAEMAIPQGG